jgi:hypothetical protein
MKNIQPIQLWVNGNQVTATQFQLQSIFDNLLNSAIFSWQLFDVNSTPLTKGELTMTNPDYDLWSDDANINNSAYQWAATLLNLTLV